MEKIIMLEPEIFIRLNKCGNMDRFAILVQDEAIERIFANAEGAHGSLFPVRVRKLPDDINNFWHKVFKKRIFQYFAASA